MGAFDNIRNILKGKTVDPMPQPDKPKGNSGASVTAEQLPRFMAQIKVWKQAIDEFEDVNYPTNETLVSLQEDAILDAHVSACMEIRKNKTLSKDFKICDENGEILEDQTEKINAKWFRDLIEQLLNVPFVGGVLLQFGNFDGEKFEGVKAYARQYVYGPGKLIRTTPNHNTGISYVQPKFRPWYLEAGNFFDLGILTKVIPSYIYKKNAAGAWANYQQIFGSPIRLGKTNMNDDNARANMEDALENMGNSSWLVMGPDDEVEVINGGQTDAHQVFGSSLEYHNKEISKAIIGSTMLNEDGSSRSQSEVHERTSDAIFKKDAMFVEEYVNKTLIPHLEKYFGFNFGGGYFKFDNTETLSKLEQFEIDKELLKYYTIPTDHIIEKYGTIVEEKQEAQGIEPAQLENLLLGGGGVGKPQQPKGSETYSAIVKDFYHLCNEAEDDFLPLPGPVLSEEQENELFEGIFSGNITPELLPVQLFFSIGETLDDGIRKGFKVYDALGLSYQVDEEFYQALRNNAFKFSGAKTFQQVREMSDLLVDEPTFKEFKDKAKKTFDQYNGPQVGSWLRTEYDQAFNGSQMASKWKAFDQDSEAFPLLKYTTIGDERVRQDHRPLDNIIRPVNDPFWDSYFPPNGWRCRCDVQQLASGKANKLDKLPEIPDEFAVNFGKKKMLFSPEHPYYVVADQYKDLKDNGFNLPSTPSKKLKDGA